MENGHAKYRVAVIGSGNWGSVASRLIASNTAKLPSFYGTRILCLLLFQIFSIAAISIAYIILYLICFLSLDAYI